MKLRVILACTLLLLAAVPTFALPVCAECNASNRCEQIPGSIERCTDWTGSCYTQPLSCSPPLHATVLTEWQVVSIEVSRPALNSTTVTAPAAVAKAEVAAPEVVEQK